MPRPRPASIPHKRTPIKRPLSPEPSNESRTPPSRQSKRLKSSKATPKKSQFFSHHPPSTGSEPESEIEAEASGYEDEDASASALSTPAPETDVSEESEEVVSSEEEDKKKKKKKRRKSGSSKGNDRRGSAKHISNGIVDGINTIVQKGKELWRPGVTSDLAPGEEVFIRLPKARGDGGVMYKEGVIHPNTMAFLGDLRANNEREWLKGMLYFSTIGIGINGIGMQRCIG